MKFTLERNGEIEIYSNTLSGFSFHPNYSAEHTKSFQYFTQINRTKRGRYHSKTTNKTRLIYPQNILCLNEGRGNSQDCRNNKREERDAFRDSWPKGQTITLLFWIYTECYSYIHSSSPSTKRYLLHNYKM